MDNREGEMATSGIHFGEGVVLVRDWDISQFIRAVAIHCEEYLKRESTAGWLLDACLAWMDDFDSSAPGVRDMELDEALAEIQRKTMFVDYLRWLKKQDASDKYDHQSVLKTIDKVLRLMGNAD